MSKPTTVNIVLPDPYVQTIKNMQKVSKSTALKARSLNQLTSAILRSYLDTMPDPPGWGQ